MDEFHVEGELPLEPEHLSFISYTSHEKQISISTHCH